MKKLLFVLLLTMSSIVHANWNLIHEDADVKMYIEISSIQQVGQFKRVWTKFEYSLDSELFLKFNDRSSRTYNEYDCREIKRRRLTSTFFKQPNLIEQSTNNNTVGEWEFIAPNTVGKKMIEAVCKK